MALESVAVGATGQLRKLSSKVKPRTLRALADAMARELGEFQREYDKLDVRGAVKKNFEDPEDPEVNLVLGRFYGLVKGNWEAGLSHLARSSSKTLEEMAKRDLAAPSVTADRVAVGDGWWALAEAERGIYRRGLVGRAVYWYRKAVPQLQGLSTARVRLRLDKRLAEARKVFKGWPSLSNPPTPKGSGIVLRQGEKLPGKRSPMIGNRALTVTASIESVEGDGVIVSQGGDIKGYALYVKNGKLTWTVRIAHQMHTIATETAPTAPFTAVAHLGKGGGMTLHVDDMLAATGTAPGPIPGRPTDGLRVGSDGGSHVGDYGASNRFAGRIRSVRITVGR